MVHFVWEVSNDTPPVWDAAYHELKGWEYRQAWQEGRFLKEFRQITSHYPPLYYLQEAVVLSFFSQTQFLALLSNLLGLWLLSYCTFGIASFYMDKEVAVWAGLLTLLFPFTAWVSRVSLLDVPLAGWVAAAGYCLLKSNLLQGKAWTLAFGLACAAGTLTKWTFPLYLFSPLVYVLIYSPDRKRSLLNAMDASILAAPIVFCWYLPNLDHLLKRYPTTGQSSLIPWQPDPRHGEPGLASVLGWIYYPRVLCSYYLYLPLTIFALWSGVFFVRYCGRIQSRLGFLWFWILGGLLFLLFVTPKDPRFAVPLVPPLAVLLIYPWRHRRNWALGIFVVASIQFVSVSFRLPFHPVKIAFFEGRVADYQSLQREWVLYQSHYFDVAGPPRCQNWRYQDILDAIPCGSSVGFVPDLAHFHPHGLKLYGLRQGCRQDVQRLGQSSNGIDVLMSLDFVVEKTGFQGVSFITHFNSEVYSKLKEGDWQRVRTWDLPDQSQAVLWRNLKSEI